MSVKKTVAAVRPSSTKPSFSSYSITLVFLFTPLLLLLLLLLFNQQFFAMGARQGVPTATLEAMAGDESLMSPKDHGTCAHGVQENLRYGCDRSLADRICCFNRHYAEHSGYFQGSTGFSKLKPAPGEEITFYDSVSGRPLYHAPRGRSWSDFLKESRAHGWPSFRDEECVAANMRVLPGGEVVSIDGTHLGHNLPDSKGNRYCINLVSVAGNPTLDPAAADNVCGAKD